MPTKSNPLATDDNQALVRLDEHIGCVETLIREGTDLSRTPSREAFQQWDAKVGDYFSSMDVSAGVQWSEMARPELGRWALLPSKPHLFSPFISPMLDMLLGLRKELEKAKSRVLSPNEAAGEGENASQRPQSVGKGVSMLDAALILNDDNTEPARETVDRWQKQRRVKAPPCIGYAPSRHSQMKLYEPTALADFVQKIEPSSVIEKRPFRQRLIGRAIEVETGPDRK